MEICAFCGIHNINDNPRWNSALLNSIPASAYCGYTVL